MSDWPGTIPGGPSGGVLGGIYPNPSFAAETANAVTVKAGSVFRLSRAS